MAYFVVAAMMLLFLQACTILDPCSPPPGEQQLVADYQSQTVWGVLPASVADSPEWIGPSATEGAGRPVVRYCDNVGVDGLHYSHDTAIRITYGPTGYWSGRKLLDVYGPVATASGWSLIAKSDGEGAGRAA